MHDLMSPQPASLTQEVLAGLIERVTYHNAENGFCVLRTKARGHRDVVTVVGYAAAISAGHGRQRCSTRSPERARSRSAFLRSTSV
jgi:exodeoxyribonuclease V alpha subunit